MYVAPCMILEQRLALVYLYPRNIATLAMRVVQVTFDFAVGIASILGLLVGIFSLVFSIKAWKKATGAEKAAKEAHEAVRRGNAADELQLLAGLAKELLACVQNEQALAAAVRGRDLVAGINQARLRWRAYFPSPEVEQRLEGIGTEGEKISKALSIRKGEITAPERERLLKFCHNALSILSGEAGRMAGHVDTTFSGR